MGGAVGAIAGGLVSGFGGSGGSSGSSSSSEQSNSYSYQRPYEYVPSKEAYAQAQTTFNDAANKALDFLKSSTADITNANQPYVTSSYHALDQLLDSMGIARPKMGTYEAQVAQREYDAKVAAAAKANPNAKYGPASEADMAKYNAALEAYNKQQAIVKDNSVYKDIYDNQLDWKEKEILDYYAKQPNAFGEGKTAFAASWNPDIQTQIDGYKGDKYDIMYGRSRLAGAGTGIKTMYRDGGTFNKLTPKQQWELMQYASGAKADVTNPLTSPTMPKGELIPENPLDPFNIEMTDPNEAATRIMQQLEADPNYRFQREQGLKALGAQASARGQIGGTRAAKEYQAFASGLASSALTDYRNRLANLIGGGQQAVQTNTTPVTAASNLGTSLLSGLGDKIAGAQLDSSRDFVLGPKIAESTSSSTKTSSSSESPSYLGNAVAAGGSILGGLFG